jgi:hypothetical protein
MPPTDKKVAEAQKRINDKQNNHRNYQRVKDSFRRFLESLPISKCNPYAHELIEMLKTISGLKKFIKFLSGLSEEKRLEWFHKAYSGFSLVLSKTAREETRSTYNEDFSKIILEKTGSSPDTARIHKDKENNPTQQLR